MSEKFVLATHNPGKMKEMSAILAELGIQVVGPDELGIDVEVEETGTTFAENAMLKATIGNEMRDWKTALACFFENYKPEE